MNYGVYPAIDLRFQPHLLCNDLPGRGILEEAARFKVQALTDLLVLDKEIQALQRKRDAMKDGLWAFDCILAPIRRLSDDVLVEIFCHCIPTTRNARPFISEAPLLLTLVCKRWRTIAMSAPRLWTTLHIPVVFNYSPRVRSQHRRFMHHPDLDPPDRTHLPYGVSSELYSSRNAELDQWLRRSGSLSLSISLYSFATPGMEHDMHAPTARIRRATLDLIARYADRISKLDVEIPTYALRQLVKAIEEHSKVNYLPRLQQLRVSSDHTAVLSNVLNGTIATSTLTAETFKIFAAKSLRALSWSGLASGGEVLIHASANLTTLLTLDAITVSEAWSALSHLHRLERCHLHIWDSADSSWSPSGVARPNPRFSSNAIVLPVLNTLSINSTLSNIELLCERLDTPSLSILHLHILPGSSTQLPLYHLGISRVTNDVLPNYPPDSTQQLCVFLTLCASLRSLIITPCYMQATEMQSIFSAVPQVEHLTLNATQTARIGSQVLDMYTPPSLGGMLEHSLDPLLRQQRLDAGNDGGVCTHLDTPLLPCLQSFEWNQTSDTIPNSNFVAFINNRLFQSPMRISADGPITASGVSEVDIRQHATSPLKSIKVRVLRVSDVGDIESGIIRHAESEGLTRGVDFQLDVMLCPSVASLLPDGPRYVIPSGFSRPEPVHISEDNLNIERNVTWPWVEF